MSNLFLGIYNYFESRKKLFYLIFAGLLAIFIFFSAKIHLQENIMQMLPQDKKTEQFAGFFQNSKFSDRVMICITPKDSSKEYDPDSLIAFTDSFAHSVQNELAYYIESFDYVANDSDIAGVLKIIDNNLPVFLDSADYLSIDTLLTSEGISKKLQYNFKALTAPTGIGMKKFIADDPLGLNFMVYKKLKSFQPDDKLELYDSHFITKDKKSAVLFISPHFSLSDIKQNGIFFHKLDYIIHSVPGNLYDIVYFGAPAVAVANSDQIRKDTIFTISITIFLLVLIVILFFRKLSAPLLMLIPVLFGGLFALTVIYFIKGEISIIALGAGSLILGIAVNYSLHFLIHCRYHPDIRDVIKELSFPLTIGSATTIGGFLCLKFVNAPVLQDMGLFAALSLIGAALASLIFLPHFVSQKAEEMQKADASSPPFYERLLEQLQNNKYLILMFVILTPLFFYCATGIQFESDINKINYMSPELKKAENIFNNIASYYQKSVFVICNGNTLNEALTVNERTLPLLNNMKGKGKLTSFTNVAPLLLSTQAQQARIARWENYWTIRKREQVLQQLTSEGKKIGFAEAAFAPFETITGKKYKPLSDEDSQILKRTFLKNFIEEQKGKFSVISTIKTSPANVKGIYADLSTKPNVIVFDRQYITDSLVQMVGNDYNFIAIFSSLLVLVALFLTYGRIELVLITFIPMLVAWVWILGIMALLGIKFNIINIILSTLIFALGDDFCIFTTDGLQQEYARKAKNIKSIRTSILLSALTTIIGLGILIFAKHPAMHSVAIISIVGIFCVWLVSQTLQPFLFNILIKNPTDKKIQPYTLWSMLKSAFAFVYFFIGALLLLVIGVILTKLVLFKKAQMKLAYHYVLSKFTGSLIYIMNNVKKKIINEQNEDFSTPAVVISNHQSFLDILLLAMLNPKLILLTNKWVWRSPVFGYVVRMADYSMADEPENTIIELGERVKEGYSIVIFPEGTRSMDDTIHRFHKGAFLLAERLNLDILPIIIHGSGYTMSKGNYLLKDGQLTLKYLPRIKPSDTTYGATYSERAKLIGRYFRQEYKILKEEIETTTYFKPLLVSNYLFKGPILEWYMKIKLRLENNYNQFDKLLPRKGNILDIGCGYGFMSYMLGYTSSERTIKGIDYDENKIEIAQNGYLKGSNVSFEHKSAFDFTFEKYDAIILSDMLHYLQPKEQIMLLEKCIANLSGKGMMVIREGIKELKKRHRGTQLSELFSTRILGFNKTGDKGLSFTTSELFEQMAAKHSLQISRIDTTRFTSNVIFVLKTKA